MDEIKNWQDFFKLAKKMREAQKSYFKTKTRSDLEQSKDFERLFDSAIKKIDEIQAEKRQGSLF